MRILHNNTGMTLIAFLCVAPRKYIEIISKYKYHKPKSYMIKGRALLKDENEQRYESFITRFI